MAGIAEVAKRAGVSKMSVSRVLNESPLVTDSTRQRVLQAMAELHYMPNSAARTLKRGRTALIAVLISNSNNPIYFRYFDGIREEAAKAGYGVMLSKSINHASYDEASLRLLHEHRVTGIIPTYPMARHELQLMQRFSTTAVCIDGAIPGCDSFMLDNGEAMEQAVDHLVGLGHTKIGIISGPHTNGSERQRLLGYRRAMRRRLLPVARCWQIIAGGWEDQDGIDAATLLMSTANLPSAALVTTSALTPGVLTGLAALGVAIPGDLAIAGVGEMSWSPMLLSPITSLVEPAYEMGAAACARLLQRAHGEVGGPPQTRRFSARLVVRLSSGGPVTVPPVTRLLFTSVSAVEPAYTASRGPAPAGNHSGR